jgi:hypothetical protein
MLEFTNFGHAFCGFLLKSFDDQGCEFTSIEECEPLLEPCFQAVIVVLLTLCADCSLFTLKPAHSSPYLPVLSCSVGSR